MFIKNAKDDLKVEGTPSKSQSLEKLTLGKISSMISLLNFVVCLHLKKKC